MSTTLTKREQKAFKRYNKGKNNETTKYIVVHELGYYGDSVVPSKEAVKTVVSTLEEALALEGETIYREDWTAVAEWSRDQAKWYSTDPDLEY